MPKPRIHTDRAAKQRAYREREAVKALHAETAHYHTIKLLAAMRLAGYPVNAPAADAPGFDAQVIEQAAQFFEQLEPGTWRLLYTPIGVPVYGNPAADAD